MFDCCIYGEAKLLRTPPLWPSTDFSLFIQPTKLVIVLEIVQKLGEEVMTGRGALFHPYEG